MTKENLTEEEKRLELNSQHEVFWKKWGTYLPELEKKLITMQ